ncbi:hypothetical protein FHG87_008153 [Trinorchestia longiramus]|nr:hypothetical protein FHG87_008153 [Trinorchestia longiramus]
MITYLRAEGERGKDARAATIAPRAALFHMLAPIATLTSAFWCHAVDLATLTLTLTLYSLCRSVSPSGPYRPPGGVEEMQGGGRRIRLEWGAYITV